MKAIATFTLFLIVIGMVEMISTSEGAVLCSAVEGAISPCSSYLTKGGSPSPSAECCAGVTQVKNMATNQFDRRGACQCLKSAAEKIVNIKPDAASSLPGQCGVEVGFPISANVDCQSIP